MPSSSSPRVLLTVNPGLIHGKRMQTIRSLVTALDKVADLLVLPIDGYDFASKTVSAYRRVKGGRFKSQGRMAPEGDLWIVYTDGYYLDCRSLGFKRRGDYFRAQLSFHQKALDAGKIDRMINLPSAEECTLKTWMCQIDRKKYKTIQTFPHQSENGLRKLLRQQEQLVAKPDWGGAGTGVVLLSSNDDVDRFLGAIGKEKDTDLTDYCYQEFQAGDEKRLWCTGGKPVAARVIKNRPLPWEKEKRRSTIRQYKPTADEIATATALCKRARLEVGSIDFIGDSVNEINGCGTTFMQHKDWDVIVDARPQLIEFCLAQLAFLSRAL